jgi:hypothetical protein
MEIVEEEMLAIQNEMYLSTGYVGVVEEEMVAIRAY